MSQTLSVEYPLSATPERAFAALTTPSILATWFAEQVDVGASVGAPFRFWGRYTLDAPDAAAATQRITHWEPNARVSFTWHLRGIDSEVTWRLTPTEEGPTKLSIAHELHGTPSGERATHAIEDSWRLALSNIECHLTGEDFTRVDFALPTTEIRLVRTIAASPSRVFEALLDPAQVAQWLYAKAPEIDPRVGGKYVVGWKYKVEGRDVVGGPTTILALEPDKLLKLDWPDWRGDPAVNTQTIRFELAPAGGATQLTFVHDGFARPADIGDYPKGWSGFLDALAGVATAAS